MKETKLKKALLKAMTKLYSESTPNIDFMEIYNGTDENRKNFNYNDYYLDSDRYDEICKEVLKESKLNNVDKKAFLCQAYMWCGPTSAPINIKHIPIGKYCNYTTLNGENKVCPYLKLTEDNILYCKFIKCKTNTESYIINKSLGSNFFNKKCNINI